jgi:dolichyl-diphosphooligosaccharide--protein glycosyltransferase
MQMISVFIWRILNTIGYEITLNDVCCLVPVWFGVCASMLLGCLTYVASGSRNAAIFSAGIMAIVPAHLMRSVGGGFDNESVAVTCLCLTFFLWNHSLVSANNNKTSIIGGILAGLAYVCMVAAWGGFVFVLNMIGIHAFVLILFGRFSKKLYWSYTLWYIVGTIGAIQVPVVGWAPLKSLEQLAPGCIFGLMQLLYLCDHEKFLKSFFNIDKATITTAQKIKVMFWVFGAAAAIFSVVCSYLWNIGYFGPLSSRVRGLFLQHTRTGNPLVDSVAEHQPAKPENFYQFLHYVCYIAPVGFVIAVYRGVVKPWFVPPSKNDERSTDPMFFIVVYAIVTYYFALTMNRLMLLMAPISAALSGIAFDYCFSFVCDEGMSIINYLIGGKTEENGEEKEAEAEVVVEKVEKSDKKGKKIKKIPKKNDSLAEILSVLSDKLNSTIFMKFVRKCVAVVFIFIFVKFPPHFYHQAMEMSVGLSHPSIMFQARMNDGTPIMVDDYRDAYFWLRDNTPQDSRVMAWWDYGYQITGIANRTTIADGNTWNHEHIALLGRCLTSPEKKAHKLVKHLADYVLIWTGGGGDDLAKSPHMARIANSVYPTICPGDPTCRRFGFINQQMKPTPMMAESLLYKLHSNRQVQGVNVDPSLFKEVFFSKYGKVRIYEVMGVSKKSRNYIKNDTNKICDAEGSWYCNGQYPPAIQKVLATDKNDFEQFEDFNKKSTNTKKTKSLPN